VAAAEQPSASTISDQDFLAALSRAFQESERQKSLTQGETDGELAATDETPAEEASEG